MTWDKKNNVDHGTRVCALLAWLLHEHAHSFRMHSGAAAVTASKAQVGVAVVAAKSEHVRSVWMHVNACATAAAAAAAT